MKTHTETLLKILEARLLAKNNWKKIILDRKWINKNISKNAGVYVLKEKKNLVYVGETGSLRGRMLDLIDSRHHCVRRTIGMKYFSKRKGFRKADSKNKFPQKIEKLVDSYIITKLSIAILEVPFGRKELEEYVQKTIKVENRLNKRGKRNSD